MEQSYYVVIPTKILYDKRITDGAKLLYGEITSLCNVKGYCWATNKSFADKRGISKRTISNWISNLEKSGYIKTHCIYEEGSKEVKERRIYISNPTEEELKDDENISTGNEKNFTTPMKNISDPHEITFVNPLKEISDPHEEMCAENIKVNNKDNNKDNNTPSTKLTDNQLKENFEKLWSLYPRKERKQDAFKSYKKAIKNNVTNKQIQDGILAYKKKIKAENTELQFVAQGGTWFSQQRWNDEFVISTTNYQNKNVNYEPIPDWLKKQEENPQTQNTTAFDDAELEEKAANIRERLATMYDE